MATVAPPMPGDSNNSGPGAQSSASPQQGPGPQSGQGFSPMGGGLPGIVQAVKMIEMGYQMLAQQLPSTAPLCASHITQLRQALPLAAGAGAGQSQPGQPNGPGSPQSGTTGAPNMPPPPPPSQQQ